MIEKHEVLIDGENNRQISLDIRFNGKKNQNPVILFIHGFKGFKDWGPWNAMSNIFADAGFTCVKLNFSHNGIDPTDLQDISLVEIFGLNTFSIEMTEIGTVLSWLESAENPYKDYINKGQFFVIGHSLGGSLALLKSIEDSRISKLATWAAPCDILKYKDLESDEVWKERGYVPILNGRTGQSYPIQYIFREDIVDNRGRFDLMDKLDRFNKPLLVVHGDEDPTVNIEDARKIAEIVDHSILLEIENGDHVFGAGHPHQEDSLPEVLNDVVEETIEFFNM